MKLLQEIINPNTVSLTDTQQGVLIAIRVAPTPEVAFQTTNGAQALVVARQQLRSLGLIKIAGNKTALSPNGEQAVTNYNLVDETGQMTERGTAIINNFNKKFNNDSQNDQQDSEQMAAPDMGQQ